MQVVRSWAQDLEDPGSEIAVRERARGGTVRVESIDAAQFVRECLDGVVGDIDLPKSYPYPQFGEARIDGFTAAQQPVFQQIEAALVARARPLTTMERARLGLAFVLEWNRRAELEETRARHAEWISDWQAGDHRSHGAA